MTERLYYSEPYRTHFTANVTETLTWQGRPAVILDRTAFYPTSGGQPADRGTLGDVTVLDVFEGEVEGDGRKPVIHVLAHALAAGDRVTGEVAWQRRFDHMQQHTGQHVLSAAFERVLGEAGTSRAATVGFHLGETSSTIDIDVADLEMDDVLPVETFANRVIWDDRPISIRLVDSEALADLPTVEPPPDVEGPIRLIEIPGPSGADKPPLDVNPCGGTHVARTGEIGMVKIVGLEHRGEDTRVEFLCGERALRDYEAKRSMASTLAAMLTVGTWELDEAVERLQAEIKELHHVERGLRRRLLDMESAELAATATGHGRHRVVGTVWQQRSPDELRTLARKLAEHNGLVALLFSVNEQRTHFCFARADDLALDVNRLLQEACAQLDGKGGGRPQAAQGSAPRADVEFVESVLQNLEALLERED